MVNMTRVMIIYISPRWPNFIEKDLWSMDIQYSTILYNNTPKMSTKMTPLEMLTRVKSIYSILINSHPCCCPVYVLDPKTTRWSKDTKMETQITPRTLYGDVTEPFKYSETGEKFKDY